MLTALIVACGAFGLAVGSFLNVVIYRVPLKKSIVSPGSACPSCETPIANRDNIPVVSWLLLRGRCRTCRAPISPRYPLVELATGALFAGTAARFGLHWDLPAFLVFFSGLLALAIIDVELLILPKSIVYWTLALMAAFLMLAAAMTPDWRALAIGAASAVGWWALFFLLNLIYPRALGFGDVRLALVLGLGLGWLGIWYVLVGFFAANLVGLLVSLALIATHRMKRSQQIPYGVFLALGASLAIFLGPAIVPTLQGH
jgi:leader peptidase (prepilin peptidase)/N-methyltransferase